MEVYLDNASTTKVSKEVFEEMLPYFKENFGNPSSLHGLGIKNRKIVNQSRIKIAELLNCKKTEIHFTSCGTESINWALKGLAFQNKTKYEIITTNIEHHATSETCHFLETLGFTINYLKVDRDGFINTDELRSMINNNTLVVSIIMANNEIGTIQNISEISKICDQSRTYLHVDAVQAVCHTEINLETLNVDLLSLSGHKFHGPKGIGLLYIKDGTHISNLIHGGQQELKRRAGTENVPYIVGLTKALEIGISNLAQYVNRLNDYSKLFLDRLVKEKINFILNGPIVGENRLPGNLNISFKDIDGLTLTYLLDKRGIFVSTGSACDSESIEPSHVIQAIEVPSDYINATVRFSIGNETTLKEINYALDNLIDILKNEI
jgi:cysteine desulfurase